MTTMNEYSVTVLVDASRNYTVKAESPEAAVEQAEELYSRESSTLCHQCSGKLDVGGAVGAIVYCEDKEVLDTSYQAARIATLEAECERLREALGRIRKQAVELECKQSPCSATQRDFAEIAYMADAALAASTGQEVEK